MPVVTKIQEQRRAANRRSIFLDGTFAFGCSLNVVARFRLREGMELCPEEIEKIQLGGVRQECLDSALRFLESRLHSCRELKTKLMRKQWGEQIIETVLSDLQRMGYLDDAKFAGAKAASSAGRKHHGPRRAMAELLRAGVKSEIAKTATAAVYATTDSVEIAMQLAQRQSTRLRKLEPAVAKRRLIGMLVRRGFDFETIQPVVKKVLGKAKTEL
jgi:regulatory protein